MRTHCTAWVGRWAGLLHILSLWGVVCFAWGFFDSISLHFIFEIKPPPPKKKSSKDAFLSLENIMVKNLVYMCCTLYHKRMDLISTSDRRKKSTLFSFICAFSVEKGKIIPINLYFDLSTIEQYFFLFKKNTLLQYFINVYYCTSPSDKIVRFDFDDELLKIADVRYKHLA